VFVFLLVGFFSLSKNVSAIEPVAAPQQEGLKMVTVATVNIYDAKITEQTGNVFKISFDLSNRTGVQPQVIYGINLTRTDENSYTVADEKIYSSEVVSLGENETKKINITYEAPKYLKGNYVIGLNAKNSNALTLGLANLGEVTLDGQGDSVEITNCFLTVKEDNDAQKKYELFQGVDVEKNETLLGNCTITGILSQDSTFAPTLTTFYRSSFGKEVRKDLLKEITLKSGEKTEFQFKIPIVETPQSYSGILVFADKNGNQVSNKVEFHYVVRGLSATVQNIRLNKDAYQKGDIANVNFFWTGSADSFPGSRKGMTGFDTVNMSILIQSGQGQECGKIAQILDQKSDSEDMNVSIPIVANCVDPVLKISITDKDGNKLSDDVFNVKSKPVEKAAAAAKYSKNILVVIIFLIVSLIAVLVFIFKDKLRGGLGMFLLLMLFSAGIFFSGTHEASADTLVVTAPALAGNLIYDWQEPGFNQAIENKLRSGTLTVNYNKTSFAPSELMTVSMTSYYSWCSNTTRSVSYEWGSIGGTQSVTANRLGFALNPTYNAGMSVPATAGSYQAFFKAGFYTAANDGECKKEVECYEADPYGTGNPAMCLYETVDCPAVYNTSYSPYTVTAPVIPTTGTAGVCGSASGGTFTTLTSTSPNLCSYGDVISFVGTGPWTWLCKSKNGGADSPQCSATKTAAIPVTAVCNDGICNGAETYVTCSQDCPPPAPYCGDGICNNGETSATCSSDCSASCVPAVCPAASTVCSGVQYYESSCNNYCGIGTKSCPAPVVNFSANPTTVTIPGTTKLTWSTSGANSCIGSSNRTATVNGGWTTTVNKALNGTFTTNPLNTASVIGYNLTCTSVDGVSTTKSTNVTASACVPTTFSNYVCTASGSFCTVPSNCGKTNTDTNVCTALSNCGTVTKPISECTSNGVTCPSLPTQCGVCANQIPWQEVAP